MLGASQLQNEIQFQIDFLVLSEKFLKVRIKGNM